MEFWWWLEPLFYTGLVTLVIGLGIAYAFDWNNASLVILAILTIPLLVPLFSCAIWFLAAIFVGIWSPYL